MRAALAASALTALVVSLTAGPAQAVSADPDTFCDVPGQELAISPISGLEEGESVTWLSTVKGTTPTQFTGEYIGKLENGLGYDANGDPRDVLLVRLDGDVVNGGGSSLPAGVWAGASGSPVYDADGALIGAVSYGFSWLADNVAGVTPAAYLKSIGQLPGAKNLGPAAQQQVSRMAGEAPPTAAEGRATMRPLQAVRVTTGTTAAKLDEISARLADTVQGFRPFAMSGLAISGGVNDGADYPIVAGGNVAVSYASGAVTLASVGTVTAVCGDEVFAYGHPDNWNSKIAANVHGASAARIVPDLGQSYKLVSAIGRVKGKVVDDRLAGVRGILGAGHTTIPVTTTSSVGDHHSTAVTHVSEPLAVASAAAAQMGNDATRMLDNSWQGAAGVRWSIEYQREDGSRHTLTNRDRYSDPYAFPEVVAWGVSDDIAALQANPFEDVKVLSVNVATTFADGYRAGRVSGVQVLRGGKWATVAPGSTLKVTRGVTYSFRTVLAPAPGTERVTEYRPFTVTVPKNLRKTLAVTVQAPSQPEIEDDASSFDELIATLDAHWRSDLIDRTLRFTTTSGQKYVRDRRLAAPTIVIVDGTRVSFTLEAATR
ncbi:hypothetical protein ACFUTX_01310 [Microbacterium sp. NPDC057407]|uniref:hypothetical protein n=1 Tax=Microbacterium sp. NPDC057407 TaxID=3346120 RepID=UPI00366C0214